MSTLTLPPSVPVVSMRPYLFSVSEYEKMVEAGIFVGKGRVELLEGRVVWKMVHNPAHDNKLDTLRELVAGLVPREWRVRVQSAITLSTSAPEPDLCLARGDRQTFDTRRPAPADIGLLVEVADSSLADDRNDKTRIYARDNIIEYWIVNIPDRQIEVYTQPSGPTANPAYAQRRDYPLGTSVPLVLSGVQIGVIAVSDLFP